MVIKKLDKFSRPREKLQYEGVEKLSDCELIALILSSGNKRQNVLELSQNLLSYYFGLTNFSNCTLSELISNNGVKIGKASKLIACFEIAKRINQRKLLDECLKDSSNLYKLIKDDYKNERVEKFMAVFLDKNYKFIIKKNYGYGSEFYSSIPVEKIISDSMQFMSKNIVIFHNHPSDDVTPSENDINSTLELSMNFALLQKVLYDHIIIGKDKFYSMKDENILKRSNDQMKMAISKMI